MRPLLISTALAAYPAVLCDARGPSSQVTTNFLRADWAAHQCSATIAMPSSMSPPVLVTPLPTRVCRPVIFLDNEGVLHAGQLLDFGLVPGLDLRAEYGALLIHRAAIMPGSSMSMVKSGLPVMMALISLFPMGLPMIL